MKQSIIYIVGKFSYSLDYVSTTSCYHWSRNANRNG